ncbi:hypothetical protein QFC19_002769 [Naganishia cerealis]|uniref:Uncharacterized protein n=1 Tax=Naganishia cerealis TaxID=610337 RepID=A0ACC2W8U4_9TREE|nr:hypothetical protein QFC19_002769 [Naganishia cerealis]
MAGPRRSNIRPRFGTDTEIAHRAPAARDRELQPWVPDADDGAASGGLDDETFGAGAKTASASSGAWDQFATNAALFGASKTTYHEELYTTRLDRTARGFRERERQAERLAREIETGVTENPHVKEERGQVVVGAGDEEERYSGVYRGKGAYVPPGARGDAAPGDAAQGDAASGDAAPGDAIDKAPEPSPVPPSDPIPTLAVQSPTRKPPAPPVVIESTTPSAAAAAAGRTDITHSLRRFADSERSKIAAAKADMHKTERERRLAELVAFGRAFKVPPKWQAGDPVVEPGSNPAAAVREDKHVGKDEIPLVNASTAAAGGKDTSPPVVVGSARITMRIPEIPPFKGARPAQPPAAAAAGGKLVVPPTADRSVPSGLADAGNGAPRVQGKPGDKDITENGMGQGKADGKDVAPSAAAAAATPTTTAAVKGAGGARLNPAASVFAFKPNPTASTFKPGNPPAVVNGARGHVAPAAVVSPNGYKGPLPSLVPTTTQQQSAGPSPAHVHTAIVNVTQQQQPMNPFFLAPVKRTPGVNIRDEFNPMRGRRSVASRPEDAPVVWQYSGRRVLAAIHHQPNLVIQPGQQQQMQHPTGMYNLHMNGVVVNPNLAGGPASLPPPPPPPPVVGGGPGAGGPGSNGLSPRGGVVQGLHHQEDERFSPSPGALGIGQGPGSVGAGMQPFQAVQPGGGPGFARMPHQPMQPMGQPGMYFIGGPMMQGQSALRGQAESGDTETRAPVPRYAV